MAQDPRALLQKAEKAVQRAGGGFSLFGGKTEKYENAADLYTQAANAFRVQKQGAPSLPLDTLVVGGGKREKLDRLGAISRSRGAMPDSL